MTLNKHIRRNFNANRSKKIRYDKDKFRFEIFKYDKKYETIYTLSKNNFTHNGFKKWWDGMNGVKSSNTKVLTIELTYNASADGDYRIETLYTNTYKVEGKSKVYDTIYGVFTINGEKVGKKTKWINNDMTYNRNYLYVRLKKGENHIKLEISPNAVFYAMVVKKYDIWQSHYPLLHDDGLVPISAKTSHTNEFQVNTLEAKFMYSHDLDELLPPTDIMANPTGLVFDYRDEINLYVTNNNGDEVQVFGGYISNLSVDNQLTTLTLDCADRIVDMEHRYCLSEIVLKGYEGEKNTTYTFARDCLKQFNYWSDGLRFLCDTTEVPISTNVETNKALVQRKNKPLATYKKGQYTNLATSNMGIDVQKSYIMLRNGVNRNKKQSVVLYDAKNKKILLNEFPNLYIWYGMGKEEWEEEIVETTKIVKHSGVSKSVQNQADKITSASGDVMVKALWKWIVNNIKHNSKKRGFYQTPAKTLSSGEGNCCCKAELLLDMCNYKRITDLQYVHTHNNNGGHVFCKINGRIVDPSTSNGWGNYYKKLGTLSGAEYSTYPDKPF